MRHLLVEVVDKPPDIIVKVAEAHGVQARPFSGKSAGCASIASDRSAQVLLHSLGQPHEDVDLVPRRKIHLLVNKRVADRPGVRPWAGLSSAGDVLEEVADFWWPVSGMGVLPGELYLPRRTSEPCSSYSVALLNAPKLSSLG